MPHYVDDYRELVRVFLSEEPTEEQALRRAIGDPNDAIGPIQRGIVIRAGLQPGHSLIDVGCGCGQLAAAIESYLSNGSYLGTDVVPQFVDFASRRIKSKSFRFSVVEGLTIPAHDESADMVTMFSVLTHLHQAESYRLLREATRTLRPGGTIVASFLEFGCPDHWQFFEDYVNLERAPHLNAFIEPDVFGVWAEHLGLKAEIVPAAAEWAPGVRLGQSMAVLRKS
jgi:SAM-dependent methyltransferase